MPKHRKIKCYSSPTGVRKPKCRQMSSLMCLPCQQALSFYDKVKTTKSVSRIRRRRQAAKLTRLLRAENYSDLCATNMVLEEELKQHHKQLEELGNGQQAIFNDVIAKEKELDNRRVQIAADLTDELLQCPWSGLAQLQQLMTTSVTADVSPATPALITPGSPDTTSSFHCSN
jgi:hypothetical protein